jgi:Fe-Mn family superoxide dismutase
MKFELPKLAYGYDALEPSIDAQTMEIHYTKHHQAYLNNLNTALEKHPELFDRKIEDILRDLNAIPEDIRTAVRNNGGGYYNHMIYWAIMGPDCGGEPVGSLAQAINQTFGGFGTLKRKSKKQAWGAFGSGWAWLSRKQDGSLLVHSTPNQDTPLAEGYFPIIGVDVWEHAYYLRYQNRRADYLSNWWNVVNWEEAERRYKQA